MKYGVVVVNQVFIQSLPVWEEWIEINGSSLSSWTGSSLPVWEEWIEIVQMVLSDSVKECLFPYGKSGLKFPPRRSAHAFSGLFPYGKSGLKFRNSERNTGNERRSLPVWEEWIEIPWPSTAAGRTTVSSRMGRVD